MKLPNLQWARLPVDVGKRWGLPSDRRIRLCANCIKSIGKSSAK